MTRYSILPCISLDGILHASIIEGSFDSEKFGEFIDILLTQMNPFPGPNSVVVMDNCRIHKLPFILKMIEQRYATNLTSKLATDLYVQGDEICLPSPLLSRS